jgi:fatty acid CoA ligase FadD9
MVAMEPDEVLGRTPDPGATMAALATAALVAAIDHGAPVRAGEDPRFRVEIEDGADGPILILHLAGGTAALALAPPPGPVRWRDAWVLAIGDGDGGELGVLAAHGPSLAIADARRPLRALLRQRRRAIVRDLDGGREVVPLLDAGFERMTAQSSAAPVTPAPIDAPLAARPFARPTRPEPAPWWELDLGATAYVARLRVELARPPAGTRVAIHAYGFLAPSGALPTGSLLGECAAEELDGDGDRARIELDEPVVTRFLRVELAAAAPVVLAVRDAEVLTAELHADSLEATLRRAFALHRDRPLVVATRGDDVVHSYGELWLRAMAFGRGLAARLPAASPVAILLANRPEWLIADLAALTRGFPVVPIAPGTADDHLAIMLTQSGAACVVTDAAGAGRLARLGLARPPLIVACDPPADVLGFDAVIDDGAGLPPQAPAPRDQGDLYTVMFTSGSTGAPRGAMYSHATFHDRLVRHDMGHAPRHLSFHPLSHVNERVHLPVVLVHGGVVAFSQGAGHLFDELAAFAPTVVGAVPRVFEVLHGRYQRRLRALAAAEPGAARGVLEAQATREAAAALGDRLLVVTTGAAPVSAELRAFLGRCFPDCWVSEGYGTTEVGMIASEGIVYPHVEVKLVPADLDAAQPGGPERGEIHVRTPDAVTRYLDGPLASDGGFIATGDLGERGADGRVRVVGRLRSAVKLAQGEFVAADRVEAVLATAPIVDRVFVHAAAGADAIAALVVPDATVLGRRLGADAPLAALIARPGAAAAVVAALRSHGRSAGLARHELPRAVLLAEAIDAAVTTSGKPARAVLAARHGAALAALAAAPDDPLPAIDDGELLGRVVRVVSRIAGHAVHAGQPLAGVGIDSLAVAEILAGLGDELGRAVPPGLWFEAQTLGELAARLERFAPGRGGAADQLRADAAAPLRVPARIAPPRRPMVVAVTGATGFLGAHLVEALDHRGVQVIALVRAVDDAAASARLSAAFDRWRIPLDGAPAIACDLAADDLGLAPGARRRLRDGIDTIIHAGAVVSWLAPYAALRAPNAAATRALLELAAEAGIAFHHVSTISAAPPGGDEDSRCSAEQAATASPYAMSKWVAEAHVRAAAAAGLATAIHRPSLIAGHARTGVGNPDDLLHRYLVGCAELGCYLDSDALLDCAPVDVIAAAIAALVTSGPPAGATHHLVGADRSPSWASLGRGLAAAGIPVAPAAHRDFIAALHAHPTTRLRPLASFLADERSLDRDAHASARTDAALAALGVTMPFIDDALVARHVAELRRRGYLRGP